MSSFPKNTPALTCPECTVTETDEPTNSNDYNILKTSQELHEELDTSDIMARTKPDTDSGEDRLTLKPQNTGRYIPPMKRKPAPTSAKASRTDNDHTSRINDADPSTHEMERLNIALLSRLGDIFKDIVHAAEMLGSTTKKASRIEQPWSGTLGPEDKADDEKASVDATVAAVVEEPSTSETEDKTRNIQLLRCDANFLQNDINLVKALLDSASITLEKCAEAAVKKRNLDPCAANNSPPGHLDQTGRGETWLQLINRDIVSNHKYRSGLISLGKAQRGLSKELRALLERRAAVLEELESIGGALFDREWSWLEEKSEELGGTDWEDIMSEKTDF